MPATLIHPCNAISTCTPTLHTHTYTFYSSELQNVASLLGVHASALQRGLTMRTYTSSRGIVQSACSAAAVSSLCCPAYSVPSRPLSSPVQWCKGLSCQNPLYSHCGGHYEEDQYPPKRPLPSIPLRSPVLRQVIQSPPTG